MSNTKQHLYLKRLAFSALLCALSIVFSSYGKMLSSVGWRLSFENLPILVGAIAMGPIYGTVIALVSDVLSCFLVGGYAPNPILTSGIMAVGLVAGLLYRFVFKNRWGTSPLALLICTFSAHFVGSVVIKSYGLFLMGIVPDIRYVLAIRVPNYLLVGSAEFLLLLLIFKNKYLSKKLSNL